MSFCRGGLDRENNATIRDRRTILKANDLGSKARDKKFWEAVGRCRAEDVDLVPHPDGPCPRGEEVLESFCGRRLFARLPLRCSKLSDDGYAVIASDCKKGARLRVIDEPPAGVDRKLRLLKWQHGPDFTGAPCPGADAVVMQEDVTPPAMRSSST